MPWYVQLWLLKYDFLSEKVWSQIANQTRIYFGQGKSMVFCEVVFQ